MKTLIIASLSFLTVAAFAQKPLVVDMVPQTTENATQISYVVLIPQAKLKDVDSNWNSYLSKDSKGSSSDLKGVHNQKNVLVKNISADRFETYSRTNETVEGVQLSVWLSQNGRALVSDAADSGLNLAAKKYVFDFAIEQYKAAVQGELKAEQSKLKNMEGELASLLKTREKSIETVNDNEREGKKTEAAMAVTNKDIASASVGITDQKEMVKTTAADPNAQKGAEKTLDNLEDDKKDLQKDNKKKGEHLNDLEKENRQVARTMSSNDQNVDQKTAAIEVQKGVVRDVQAKLSNIK